MTDNMAKIVFNLFDSISRGKKVIRVVNNLNILIDKK